jgi:putative copper export protein
MRRFIPLILDTIAVVALAVWLGGLVACWMVLSPTVNGMPVETIPMAQKLFAETLRRFSGVVEACGLVLAAIQWVLRRRYQRDQSLFVADGARMLVVFVALFCAEYGRYVLIPTLLKTQAPAAASTLAALAVAQAVLLIGYTGITGWLRLPRLSAVTPTPPRSSEGSAILPPRSAPRRRTGK